MGDSTTPSLSSVELSKFRQALVGFAPIALLVGWFTGGNTVHTYTAPKPPKEAAVALADGRTLYLQHCASCHGEKGDGNGIAGLKPRARYFGRDKYKFTSTRKGDSGGVPTDDDLMYIIRNGIHGTAMPPFQEKMNDDQMRAVVAHLRTLTRAGLAKRFFLEAEKNDEDPDWKEIAKKVERDSPIGEPVTIPQLGKGENAEAIARGRALFVNTAKVACASCHGNDGRGDGKDANDKKNDLPHLGGDGEPNKPRDLTSGIFKGGREPERLYTRILHGIPGTPMPPHSKLTPQEVEDLIQFVLSLSQRSDEVLR
jgi:mono/diheme cytochrome c family protein